jgi:fanconi anemia group D2 protein
LEKENISSLREYNSHLQGILDYIELLEIDQIRSIYRVFANMAFLKTTDESSTMKKLQDILKIDINKQLSSGETIYMKIGIIGVCSIISSVSSGENLENVFSQTKSDVMLIDELLKLSISKCNRYPTNLSFLYDELSILIDEKKLDSHSLLILSKQLNEEIHPYLIEYQNIGGIKKINDSIEYEFSSHVLDEEFEDSSYGINMFFFNENNTKGILNIYSGNGYELHWNLFSLFRLFQKIENLLNKKNNHQADQITKFPILFLHKNFYLDEDSNVETKFFESLQTKKEKEFICNSFFLMINWLREIINSICNKDSQQFIDLTRKRINQLIDIETAFDKILYLYKYQLNPVHLINKPISSVFGAPKKKESDSIEKKKLIKNYKPTSKYINKLRPYFREFDVLIIFKNRYQ